MSAPFPFTGFVDFDGFPARESVVVRNVLGQAAGFLSIRDRTAKTWFEWLSKLLGLQRQIRVAGTLDFAPRDPQTSDELSIVFVIGGQFVPKNSFVLMNGPLDPVTGAFALGPPNSLFTARMADDNIISVRFHNYSAASINAFNFGFEFLIIPQR